MHLINFTNAAKTLETYGGAAGRKLGIMWENKNWLLKFPDKLGARKLKNVNLSYSNGPVSEYLGSEVYRVLGFDTHKTLLGTYDDKLVCACKHIQNKNETLREFKDLRMTYIADLDEADGGASSDGTNTDINSILSVIRRHPIIQLAGNVEQHFWNMFVVDALIGNPDRNNGNWGLLTNSKTASVRIAPVYDNGASFNNKWDDEKFEFYLENETEKMAYDGVVNIFTQNEKRVNPWQLMAARQFPGLLEAMSRIAPVINSRSVFKLFDDLHEAGLLSPNQNAFYKRIFILRIEKLKSLLV